MHIARRALLDGEFVRVGHVCARPSSSVCGEIEHQDLNVLVLPLAGVFAKHDGPRRHVIGTPSHAVWIAADRPYRISYPGGVGDECLTLRLSNAALARVLRRTARRCGPAAAAFASLVLLPPAAMLARSLLWRRLAGGAWDAMDVEERSIRLLVSVLTAAGGQAHGAGRSGEGRWLRPVERVKEAVALHPERRWTLSELADLASVSPYHLAHVFRAQVGTSVYRYLLRARLAKALDAVLDTDRGLAAIALDTGFASHSHFTARFRALFGLTPTELRRGAKPGEAAQLRKIVTAANPAAD